MLLFGISLLIIGLSLIFKKTVKISKFLIILSFCFVCIVYIGLSANSTKASYFYPNKELKVYPFTGNYYNWLMNNFLNKRLDLNVDKDFVRYLENFDCSNFKDFSTIDTSVKMFYDTSLYKDKVYLYFGITPVLLFYMPFYLATHYFISDHFVILFVSIFVFLLQILIYKKIMKLLNKEKEIDSIIILILGLCNGILLTYISITIHLIALLTSIFCSLVAIYIYLLLDNNKHIKTKMFFIGLFLSLAVGARPISVFLLILMFVMILKNDNFDIKNNFKKHLCFLIPCIFYGSILATYNYLRFDSILEFGFTYQYSSNYIREILVPISLFLQHFFYNIFLFPKFYLISPFVIFDNIPLSNMEPCIGLFIVFPFCVGLLYFYKYIVNLFNKNKKIIILFFVLIITSFIYLIVDSYKGSNARFICEILFLIMVPSLVLFKAFFENIKNKNIYNFVNCIFYILLIVSLYINTNLINCIFLMSKNGMI